MIHTTTVSTSYILGDQMFNAIGLVSDYAGVDVNAQIERIEIRRVAKQGVTVLLFGRKLRKNGSVSNVDFSTRLSVQYDADSWANVWDQMPDLTKLGLTDEDRLSVTPR